MIYEVYVTNVRVGRYSQMIDQRALINPSSTISRKNSAAAVLYDAYMNKQIIKRQFEIKNRK